VGHGQGDQIGRIFADLAIVFFGQLIENYRRSAISWATFFHSTSYELILQKNDCATFLGDFFTNSSGHPGHGKKVRNAFQHHNTSDRVTTTRPNLIKTSTYRPMPSTTLPSCHGLCGRTCGKR
jgi:hypothetical protein